MNAYSLTDEDDARLTWAVVSDFIKINEPCVVIPLSLIEMCEREKLVSLIHESIDQAKLCSAEQTALHILECNGDAPSLARNCSSENIAKVLLEMEPFIDSHELINRAYFIAREARYIQKDERDRRDRNLTVVQKYRREINRNRRSISIALTKRDGYKCARCKAIENLEIDHIQPLSKNGGNDLENLQWLCRPCNLKKGTNHIDFRMNGGAQ